jgi:hypothetical protein
MSVPFIVAFPFHVFWIREACRKKSEEFLATSVCRGSQYLVRLFGVLRSRLGHNVKVGYARDLKDQAKDVLPGFPLCITRPRCCELRRLSGYRDYRQLKRQDNKI